MMLVFPVVLMMLGMYMVEGSSRGGWFFLWGGIVMIALGVALAAAWWMVKLSKFF